MALAHGASEVCYVVRDLEKNVRSWAETTGAGPFFLVEAVPQNIVDRGRPSSARFLPALGFLGSTVIEFVQPLDNQPSLWREILDTKGEGVHHIYPGIRPLSAAEYDAQIAKYERSGLQVAWSSLAPPFGRNCFFDALDRIGCFIELLEINEVGWHFASAMYEAHQGWDGRRPLRNAAELLG